MDIDSKLKVGVLMGGLSKERDISLKTGKAIAQALRSKGYVIEEIDVGHDVASVLVHKNIEVAVIALHGTYGEDGTIQGLLEYLRIPYTGSGVVGSAVAMDKEISKQVFQSHGLPTPPWLTSDEHTPMVELTKRVGEALGYPCIAKPACEGSTLGLSKVSSFAEVESAHQKALKHGKRVLWEKYIAGKEFTVSVLKGRALPVVEIVPHGGLFDYEAKYTKGKTDYFCPARIDEADARLMQEVSLRAFKAVGAESFGRVDLMFGEQKAWILEVNTIPGMTETSLLPKAAKAAGMSFEDLAEHILKDASLKVGA